MRDLIVFGEDFGGLLHRLNTWFATWLNNIKSYGSTLLVLDSQDCQLKTSLAHSIN